MGFHRLTVPSYAGGLRSGDDYINNAVSGVQAPADGALSGGTYAGSYFFAQSGQVTSAALNRAVQAVANNCDILDDFTTQMVLDYVAADAVVAADAAADLAAFESVIYGIRLLQSSDTLTTTDGTIVVDSVTFHTPITLALCDPATVEGHRITIIGLDVSVFTLTLNPFGSEKINGVASFLDLRRNYGRWTLVSDGTDWHVGYEGATNIVQPEFFSGPLTTTISVYTDLCLVNTSGGAVTLTLPDPSGLNKHRMIRFKDVGGTLSTNALTIARNGGTGNIEGVAANYIVGDNGAKRTLWSDGTNWWLV